MSNDTLRTLQVIWRTYDRAFAAACQASTHTEQSRLVRIAADARDSAIRSLAK